MRELNSLTIAEFYEYQKYINENDYISIIELFMMDSDEDIDISIALRKIMSMTITPKKISRYYVLSDKKYFAELNLLKINAEQFVDLQMYLNDFKLEEVLSIFLLPTKKRFGFLRKTLSYGKGYDISDTINYIKNNMTIGDAISLTNFYLGQSISLTKVTKDYLTKKLYMSKYKQFKKLINNEYNSK
jgi:hypothetical protein